MNLAVTLIMTCVFLRAFNIPIGDFDIACDMVGILAALAAAALLRKKEYEFKEAYIPSVFALVLSVWSFVNLMPDTPSVGFGIIYVALETGLLTAEAVMYKKLFDGFGAMYGEVCTRGFGAVKIYLASKSAGTVLTLAVWLGGANEELWWLSLLYILWTLANIVAATYLAYNFYLLKPKFKVKGRR